MDPDPESKNPDPKRCQDPPVRVIRRDTVRLCSEQRSIFHIFLSATYQQIFVTRQYTPPLLPLKRPSADYSQRLSDIYFGKLPRDDQRSQRP
jgi:hypothetical protein